MTEISDERLQAIANNRSFGEGEIEAIATELLSRRSLDDGVEPVAWMTEATDGLPLNKRGTTADPEVAAYWAHTSKVIPLFASRTPNTETVVKALEWRKSNVADRWVANHPWGEAEIIYDIRSDEYGWFVGGVWFWCKTLDEAQARAQETHDQRIRSALASSPSPAEVSDELRRVAEKMLAYRNVEYVPNVLFEQLEEALQLGKEG
jgi:hypothetical protein